MVRFIAQKNDHICSTIDGVYESGTPVENWGLYQKDEDYNPTMETEGLHESLYKFDPSEKGMATKNLKTVNISLFQTK